MARKEESGRWKQKECATVRMKIYKYVRLRDDWVDRELRKERKPWQKKKERDKGLESRGRRKRRKRFDWGRLSSVSLLCATWPCCLRLCSCLLVYVCVCVWHCMYSCIMAAHIPRQQWNSCLRVLCALLLYKYKTKMNKNEQQNHICNTSHLMIHTCFPFIHWHIIY